MTAATTNSLASEGQIAATAHGRSRLIIKQAVQYFSGSGFAILGSAISYPLLTRLLTQRDYGMMTIISSSIFLAVSLSKVGLQNSIVRFYPEYSAPIQAVKFRSTLFWVPILNSVALSAVVLAVLGAIALRITNYPLREILVFAAPIVVLETALAIMVNFMRAAQQAGRYTVVYTASRYGQLLGSLVVLLFFRRDVTGFYIGWLAWDVLLLGYLVCSALFVERTLNFGPIDRSILKIALHFGTPLLFMEIGGMILTYGDRYVIATKLGAVETGVYSAAYNFTASMQMLFVTSLSSFVFPWASEIWTKHSREESEQFAAKVLDYFLLIAIPACVGVSILREPIMLVFASAKYLGAANLIPPLIAAQMAYGVYVVLSLGLFLQKRTATMALQLVSATALNIVANVILIPRVGLMGAAYAMCAANGLLIILALLSSTKLLSVRPTWATAAKAIIAATVMGATISLLPINGNLARLLLCSPIGALLYLATVIMIDSEVRSSVINVINPAKILP